MLTKCFYFVYAKKVQESTFSLLDARQVFSSFHLIGLALGLGGATITDILFSRALHRLRVNEKELEILKLLSKVIWVGLALIAISGFLLFISNPTQYLQSQGFFAKMSIVLILIINGLVLNFIITPRIHNVFNSNPSHDEARRIAFGTGAISITSWYGSLFIAMLKSQLALSYFGFMGAYFAVLILAIIISQFAASQFSKKLQKASSQPPISPPTMQ